MFALRSVALSLVASVSVFGAPAAPDSEAPHTLALLYEKPADGAAATRLDWTLENVGAATLRDVRVVAFPCWLDPRRPALETERTDLAPADRFAGAFERPADIPPGTWFVPLRADGWDEAGRAVRAWRCPRVGPPPPRGARAPVRFAFSVETNGVSPRGPFPLSLSFASATNVPLALRVRLLLPSGVAAPSSDPAAGSVDFPVALAPGAAFETNVLLSAASRHGQQATVRAVAWTEPDSAPQWAQTRFVRFSVADAPGAAPPPPRRLPWAVPLALLLLATVLSLRPATCDLRPATCDLRLEELLVVSLSTLYLAWLLRAWLVFAPGLVLGGDLPAHHYLMDHIARSGRCVSWADGWWGGFPAFRYYFPLPYWCMAQAGKLLGHDLAFKLGSILGLLLLPTALWGAGRLARLPRPAPAFLAALALPLALDNTHNMWGANAYSTLAGMIANSWSFALFPVALALGVRDAARGRVSLLSPLVFAALALSHFFTAVLAALALAALVLWALAARRPAAARTLAIEGLWAGALAAWWLLPLFATGAWSVAFGEQWDIRFWRQLPPMLSPAWLAAAALAATAAFARFSTRRHRAAEHKKTQRPSAPPRLSVESPSAAWAVLHAALFAGALFLFFFGRSIGEVFVNCRLWPFLVYALLVGVAGSWAALAAAWRVPRTGALAFFSLCAALAWREGGSEENPAWSRACHVPYWAEYNLRGVEALPCGDSFFRIAERVAGRPGLVAWDMTDANEALGSSRCFEALPYVAPGTRTLEGGIVNSALGALAAYTVQGEVSDAPAGWPLLVSPRAFDPASGLRHLELLGVRTFVARSRAVQAAFEADPAWALLGAEGPADRWKIYGSALKGEPDVRVWKEPLTVASGHLSQRLVADWWACRGATAHPVAFRPDLASPPEILDAWRDAPPPEPGWLDRLSDPVRSVRRGADGSLAFETDFPGRPHVLAATWYPDWRAEGAEGPYPLSSGQIVVYPTGRSVRLHHAPLPAARLGAAATLLALAVYPALFAAARRRRKRNAAASAAPF